MSISDDEFDELPEEMTLKQKIVEFLGKERRAYTAEEIRTGLGPEIILHHKIPGPYDVSASTIPFPYSLEVVTATLEAMVQKLDARSNPHRPLEARKKGDVHYYRLRREANDGVRG